MITAILIPLLWLAIVLYLGSASFGPRETGRWLIPFLSSLVPWATVREVAGLHLIVRKLLHLTEYAVLARLWLHGLLVWRRISVRTAAWAALLICFVCGFVDELHQSMLLNRTGSAADMVLDCLGALLMLMMLRARYEPARATLAGRAAAAPGE